MWIVSSPGCTEAGSTNPDAMLHYWTVQDAICVGSQVGIKWSIGGGGGGGGGRESKVTAIVRINGFFLRVFFHVRLGHAIFGYLKHAANF